MFDFIFNIFEAWNQIGLLLMGSVFMLIGGSLAGYEIAWHLRGKRIKGVITEVRVKENNKSTLNRNAPIRKDDEEEKQDEETITEMFEKEPVATSIGGYVMLVIALGLAGGAYFTGLNMLDMTRNGIFTSGEVVDIKSRYSSSSGSSSGGYTYHAVVSYTDKNRESIRFEDSVGSSNPIYKGGEQVQVLYLADDPQGAIIDRGFMNWGGSGGLLLELCLFC